MRNFLVYMMLMSVQIISQAQVTFQKSFGGLTPEIAFASCATSDGGAFVAGSIDSFGYMQKSIVIRLDSMGIVKWSRTYGPNQSEVLTTIHETNDGGFIAFGGTGSGFGFGYQDIHLLRCDSIGDTLWTKTFGDTGGDYGTIHLNMDGSYILYGRNSFNGNMCSISGLNAQGNVLWSKTVTVPWIFNGESIGVTSDGSILIPGMIYNSKELFLIKLEATGTLLWAKKYGNVSWSSNIFKMTLTNDGGCLLSGWIDTSNTNIGVIYIDSNGDTNWTRRYGGPGSSYLFSMDQTSTGNFIGAGLFADTTGALLVFCIDQSGDIVFSNLSGRTGISEVGRSIVESKDGGFYISGNEEYYTNGDYNIYVAKVDSLGRTGCEDRPALINSLGFINLQDSSFQPSINISTLSMFNTAISIGTGISENTFCSSIGISEFMIVHKLNLYPNPSGGEFHISFSEKNPYEKLTICNALGKIILLKEMDGEQSFDIDLNNQPPGIYLLRFESGNQYQTARICLTK